MPSFKLIAPPATVAITGYQPHHGILRDHRGLKKHDGPTFELTATLPHDGERRFNVPFPLGPQALCKRVASHGPILSPAKGRELEKLMYDFAEYVVNNHGWDRPYRHPATTDE